MDLKKQKIMKISRKQVFRIKENSTGIFRIRKCNRIFIKNGKDVKDFCRHLHKMTEDFYAEIERLCGEDKFKKIEFSADCTDIMSNFFDK
jgi:hypothetical protein